jgi:hypothetical protein
VSLGKPSGELYRIAASIYAYGNTFDTACKEPSLDCLKLAMENGCTPSRLETDPHVSQLLRENPGLRQASPTPVCARSEVDYLIDPSKVAQASIKSK